MRSSNALDLLLTLALALASFFTKLGYELGKQQGRVELTEQQRRIAEAMRADFEALAGDGRSLDAALDGLRNRAANRDGSVPKPPAPD